MPDRLATKTAEYERMLAEDCSRARVTSEGPPGPDGGPGAVLEMAEAYLEDGRYFREHGDLPNALAAFAYGHGWLDAGIRMGVIVERDE